MGINFNKTKLNIRCPLSIRPWQHVLEPLNGYVKLAELMHKNHKINALESKYECKRLKKKIQEKNY